jgi:hypothetical protein
MFEEISQDVQSKVASILETHALDGARGESSGDQQVSHGLTLTVCLSLISFNSPLLQRDHEWTSIRNILLTALMT